MPYWNSSADNLERFTELVSKPDALVTALGNTTPITIVGDFNCALPILPAQNLPDRWYELRGFSQFSLILQTFMDDHSLTVAEFQFPQHVSFTYQRGSCFNHIDHILVSDNLIESVISCNIATPPVDNLSPHLPVSCEIRFVPRCKKPPSYASPLKVVAARPDVLK